ncbi:hypothetical protein OA78_1047 [Latilactobacillus curvatus]|nr:hypothetical protein [Latilactobacillus curvatus]EHE86543.1 hypothetical protein CRL705_328 [Latilactobacillus curvatus CRL 705]KHO12936.1 hypothetical protein OA78_1047 [Latilactobacillus curvatus]
MAGIVGIKGLIVDKNHLGRTQKVQNGRFSLYNAGDNRLILNSHFL